MATTLMPPVVGEGDSTQHLDPYTLDLEKPAIPPRASRPLSNRPSLVFKENALPIDLIDSPTSVHSNPPVPTIRQSATATPRKPMCQDTVQRWAGLTRTVTEWDGLRRDPELWFEDGDCHVHLYAQGASRRGPSLRIPFRALRQKKCGSLLDVCYAETVSSTGATSQLVSMSSTPSIFTREPTTINLYIPAPEEASREDSFRWHITTRNFFAFVLGKPLVGYHMGQTFVDLQKRLLVFRPNVTSNHHDFLQYAEDQGYRDFVECTDYALACLFYAEYYKLRDVWIDAFAHCVGMSDSVGLSPEYGLNSRLTKALITRASLEVDIHLSQVTSALSRFLEEDFSPAYLGLTYGARNHLEQFRSFLHGFYVEKFGYWPPPRGSAYPKALYKSMYYDFKNLYDFLVDLESTTDLTSQAPASGGICVLQNVDNFDKRHKFAAQLHPLPLLPAEIARKRSGSLLRRRSMSPEYNKGNHVQVASVALARATNSDNDTVMNSRIVHAYMHYEATYSLTSNLRDEKVSVVDARKIRWLVIYGTLQYLVSALHAPKEVRDSETPDYPLCCLVSEKQSWSGNTEACTSPAVASICTPPAATDRPLASPSDANELKPDCSRDDYFSSRPTSRRTSIDNPSSLKSGAVTPKASVRPTRPRSLSVKLSRKNSMANRQYCEIVVHGFGNGLNEAVSKSQASDNIQDEVSPVTPSHRSSILPEGAGPDSSWLRSARASALITENLPVPENTPVPENPPVLTRPPTAVSGARHTRTRTPHMDTLQLEQFLDTVNHPRLRKMPSRSDSGSSTNSQVWSENSAVSSESSAYEGSLERKNAVEDSGLLGGLVSIDNPTHAAHGTTPIIKAMVPAPLSVPSSRPTSQDDHDSPHSFTDPALHTIGMAYTVSSPQPVRPSIDSQLSVAFDPPTIARYTPPPCTTTQTPEPHARHVASASTSSVSSRRSSGIFTSLQSRFEKARSPKEKRMSFWRR